MTILARVVQKTERLVEVGEKVVFGWEIKLLPVEGDLCADPIVFGGCVLTTLFREVAAEFVVGQDVEIPLGVTVTVTPPKPQIARVGVH